MIVALGYAFQAAAAAHAWWEGREGFSAGKQVLWGIHEYDDDGEVMSELHTLLIRHGSLLPLFFQWDILLLRADRSHN